MFNPPVTLPLPPRTEDGRSGSVSPPAPNGTDTPQSSSAAHAGYTTTARRPFRSSRLPPRAQLREGAESDKISQSKSDGSTESRRKRILETTSSTRESKRAKISSLDERGLPRILTSSLIAKQQQYFDKFSVLIRYELEDEMADVDHRLKTWTRARLEREGVLLTGLHGELRGRFFSDQIVHFTRTNHEPLPRHHRFAQGDMVTISRRGPLSADVSSADNEHAVIEGVVTDKRETFLQVAVKTAPPDLAVGTWRLDKGANRVTYDRELAALEVFCHGDGGTSLKPLLLGDVARAAAWAGELPDYAVATPALRALLVSDYAAEAVSTWRLNDSQQRVAAAALRRRMTLVQGPPGTGKTTTAVALIKLFVAVFKQVGVRIGGRPITVLATANTNTACDNLLEGLADAGVNAVRIGRPAKVREELRENTLESRMRLHRDWSAVEAADAAGDRRYTRELTAKIVEEVLANAEVLCTTCVGAGHDILEQFQFPVVLIDESTQATEPAALCALVKKSQQAILLGDHYQLPPTVTSSRAEAGGLSRSMFQRLVDETGICPYLLATQYRMHPSISAFPSKHFYNGQVRDGLVGADRPAPAGFPWPNAPAFNVAFVAVAGGDAGAEQSTESASERGSRLSHSKLNKREAAVVVSIVRALLATGSTMPKQIGVITPYNGQVRLLSDLLDELVGNAGRSARPTVGSVDGFQGREKDIIIFSCVRSNPRRKVGFLKDWKRLNVALTRARRGLIVVGDPQTLSADSHWREWLKWIRENLLEMSSEDLEAKINKPSS